MPSCVQGVPAASLIASQQLLCVSGRELVPHEHSMTDGPIGASQTADESSQAATTAAAITTSSSSSVASTSATDIRRPEGLHMNGLRMLAAAVRAAQASQRRHCGVGADVPQCLVVDNLSVSLQSVFG